MPKILFTMHRIEITFSPMSLDLTSIFLVPLVNLEKEKELQLHFTTKRRMVTLTLAINQKNITIQILDKNTNRSEALS